MSWNKMNALASTYTYVSKNYTAPYICVFAVLHSGLGGRTFVRDIYRSGKSNRKYPWSYSKGLQCVINIYMYKYIYIFRDFRL